jgi:adenylate cyclase
MLRLNLRSKLLLFSVVIAIIPLLIAGQSLIRIARDELKSSANDQLVTVAKQTSEEADALFEHAWLAPLILVRNAIDGEGLGVQEKIALLRQGVADLADVVALQISLEGARVPPVATQERYTDRLRKASLDPLAVLRTPPEAIWTMVAKGGRYGLQIEYVPQIDGWLATLVLPLANPIAGNRAAFSARIDLTRLATSIQTNPFQRTGTIKVVDAAGREVLDKERADLRDNEIVAKALSLLSSRSALISMDRFTRPDGEVILGAFSFARAFQWAVIVEKSERNAYYAVGEMLKSLGIWLSAGLAAAALGSVLFAFRISRPILRIGEAALEVGKGNFQARVTGVRSRDEIGQLAERINTMIVQINERFQLAKFVSGGTMAAIQKSDHEGVKLGGERREVAMLFADIRGYTAFSEGRDPETVVEVLNYYFQRLADVVQEHHGDIDKFVGDEIMAVFLGEEMVDNALACCLAFQEVMQELALKNPDWGLEVGSGVDAGGVVMGAMGSKQRMDYTVLGDHVNLAARLCSHAARRQTLVSEGAYQRVKAKEKFFFEPLEPINVKGKAKPQVIYAVHPAAEAGAPAVTVAAAE